MAVGVGKPPTQLEAEAITERVGVAIHRPPNPWRRRLIWAVVVVVALGIGLLLTPGFPERLVVNVAKVFDSFQEWVIDEPGDEPAVHLLPEPHQGRGERAAGRDDERLEPDDVRRA